MTEEEKKKMADLEKSVTELTKTVKERDEAISTLQSQIKEKDQIITDKTRDVVETRRKYKKLSEMTQEELDQLSDKEKELQQRQEEFEARQSEFEKSQTELATKERLARRDQVFKKLVGNNPDFLKKITDNYDRIKDADKAMTEEEISKLANDAFNMLGADRPDPVRNAVNDGSGLAPGDTFKASGGTSDERLSEIAGGLNLPTEAPKAPDAGAGAGAGAGQ